MGRLSNVVTKSVSSIKQDIVMRITLLDENMEVDDKWQEVHDQLQGMSVHVAASWVEMAEMALESGALSEEMLALDNWLLAKAVVDCWCRARHYAPLSDVTKQEFDNLYKFI